MTNDVEKGEEERSDGGSRNVWFLGFRDSQVLWPLLILVGLFSVLLLMLSYVYDQFRLQNSFLPENSLPVLLITGTVALLLSIATLVIVYAHLDLDNEGAALGLPEGSIRAVIALLLIVLFFITAVFLYADVGRNGPDRLLDGITAERLATIPTDEIVSVESRGVGDNERFDVVLSSRKNAASVDIAQQLITTVSTLVVAVAAFYFGANSVTALMKPADRPLAGGQKGPGTARPDQGTGTTQPDQGTGTGESRQVV